MEIDIDRYLSDDEKKKIAERVYEEELRKKFDNELNTHNPDIYHDKNMVYI